MQSSAEMNDATKDAIVLYCIALALLFVVRPEPVFDRGTGRPRQFGFDEGQTVLNVQTVVVALALATYAYTSGRTGA